MKSSSGQGIIQVNDGASGYPGATMDPGDAGKNKWVKLYFTFTAKGNTAQVYIGRSGGGTNGTYWFTGVKLEEGSKLTAWNPANEDIDGLIGKVVTPNGDIKALDIASSMSVTPGAIDVVSKNINLKGKVTFSDFASGWALDSKGNKISNSDQPGYDPAKPLYLIWMGTTDLYQMKRILCRTYLLKTTQMELRLLTVTTLKQEQFKKIRQL